MLAALHVLAALGSQDRTLSALLEQFSRYADSGEVNTEVADADTAMKEVREAFESRKGVEVDDLDGLTVDLSDGSWFNLRASNTEPLVRLNVEAPDAGTVDALRDEVLAIIR
jgi:phosphomannomutase